VEFLPSIDHSLVGLSFEKDWSEWLKLSAFILQIANEFLAAALGTVWNRYPSYHACTLGY